MKTTPFYSAAAVSAFALAGVFLYNNTSAAPALAESAAPTTAARVAVRYRDITIPAGTVLPITLDSPVASDTSRIEDLVRAHLRRAVVIDGETILPASAALVGYVTSVERPGRVRGRGRIAFRFSQIAVPNLDERLEIQTSSVARVAPATKRQDAMKIGVPAAGGAIIGALVGGKRGAAIGAAAGGGAGTAVVLSTRGREVRIGRGASTSVRLLQPLTVRTKV